MQVETYEVEELFTEQGDKETIEKEAIGLIEKLDLEGQQSLISADSEGKDQRIPYPKMKAEEERVFLTLYPVKSKVNKYSAGIIPLRVLQIIAWGKDIFESMEVWHARVADPDPVLVGLLDGDTFLLARWGNALRPWKELQEEAKEHLLQTWTRKAKNLKAECEQFLIGLESKVEAYLSGEYVSKPFY